ncbi:MAG: hypothetical protein WDM77_15470 [Steroidobacteraceae bacterium]
MWFLAGFDWSTRYESSETQIGLFGMMAVLAARAGAEVPEVTVIPVYEGMASYAEALSANPAADRQLLWKEKVITPILAALH